MNNRLPLYFALAAGVALAGVVFALMWQTGAAGTVFQLTRAGSAERASQVVLERGLEQEAALEAVFRYLALDFVLMLGYVVALWAAIRLATSDATGARRRESWMSDLGVVGWPMAMAFVDCLENRGVVAVLRAALSEGGIAEGSLVRVYPQLTLWATAIKWTIGALVLLLLATLLLRWMIDSWRRRERSDATVAEAVESLAKKKRWRGIFVLLAALPRRFQGPKVVAATSFDEVLRHEREAIGEGDRRRTVGLAFSGGGIRSATFNLGILQALADHRLLGSIHYLSTVSGGGYIGSWFSQWLRRRRRYGSPDAVGDVSDALRQRGRQDKPEADPIVHLRNYSNYLTPKLGLLSADTWTTVATYLRNMLLNVLIIVSVVGLALLLPRAIVDWLRFLESVFAAGGFERIHIPLGLMTLRVDSPWAVGIAALLSFVALFGAGINLARTVSGSAHSEDGVSSQPAIQRILVIPLILASIVGAYWLKVIPVARVTTWLVGSVLVYVVAWCVAGVVAGIASKDRGAIRLAFAFVAWALPVGVALGFCLSGLNVLFEDWTSWTVIAFGPMAVLIVITLGITLQVGLLGTQLEDRLREWLSRAGAWALIYGLAWSVVAGLALWGPILVAQFSGLLRTGLATGWVATSVGGALLGSSQKDAETNIIKSAFLRLAPWVFIFGLVAVLSFGLDALLSRHDGNDWRNFATQPEEVVEERVLYDDSDVTIRLEQPDPAQAIPRSLARLHTQLLDRQQERGEFWLWIFGLVAVAWVLQRRVAINEFSMHQYYRNRLVRAYLGASNTDRRPHPFTGFDPNDDSALGHPEGVARPFHIINAALNLVNTSRLGWQERKAAAFSLTPLYGGFQLPPDAGEEAPEMVYRRTDEVDGLTLGTALAISGAAASPNMGHNSSPSMALLLTFFNVRLGWWLGNPRRPRAWRRGRPASALQPLLAELFGLTSSEDSNVYLSDGAHFENLGVYELVRRRCRFIIATDAGADPDMAFVDLGNAIRKCRTDLGARIEIDIETLRPNENGVSRRHCAVGKIEFAAETDGALPETGYLLYIKSTMTGDEEEDVQQYAEANPAFPHQTTADQFFDESQFESYRMLGRHVGRRVFGAVSVRRVARAASTSEREVDWEDLFRQLRQRWYPPSGSVELSFSRHGEKLDQLFDRLASQDELDFLDAEMYPAWRALAHAAQSPDSLPDSEKSLRSGFYICSSMIQLMENVYLDLHLDEEHSHPDNRGWLNLFRQWVRSDMMRATWALSAGTYGARFQTFCLRRLGLEQGQVGYSVSDEDFVSVMEAEIKGAGEEAAERIARHGNDGVRHEWLELELVVGELELRLPIGFCLIERCREGDGSDAEEGFFILYFQIYEHLRKTGLAQRGLQAVAEYHGARPIDVDAKLERVGDRTWRSFHNLYLSSVR